MLVDRRPPDRASRLEGTGHRSSADGPVVTAPWEGVYFGKWVGKRGDWFIEQAVGLVIAVVAVPVVFPDGRLVGPRWHWLAWSAIAGIIFLFLGNVLAPHTQEGRLAGWHSPLGLPVRYGKVADALA